MTADTSMAIAARSDRPACRRWRPAEPAEALRVRRRERLRMLPMVVTSYLVDTDAARRASAPSACCPGACRPFSSLSGLLIVRRVPSRPRQRVSGTPARPPHGHGADGGQLHGADAILLWTPQVGVPLMMLSLRHLRLRRPAHEVSRRRLRLDRAGRGHGAGGGVSSARTSACRSRRPRSAPSAACGSRPCCRAWPSSASTALTCARCSTSSAPS